MSRILKFLTLTVLTLIMFAYPHEVLTSAFRGLSLWGNYVLPALFPFFILSELLMKQGFVDFLGALLEPLMRPLFHLPGRASFIIAMTHTSGIPIGAVLTCKMRKAGEITRVEGERLLAFTCNPSPGFMFGAVASGMLNNPALGIVIAGSVYLANLIVGFVFRFYGRENKQQPKTFFSLKKAWQQLGANQKSLNKPLGEIMAEAVRDSTSTVLLVGGFIIVFSVITHLLTVLHIDTLLAAAIMLLTRGGFPEAGSNALIQGFMETTLGCKAAAGAFPSLYSQVGMITFLLGWGGLSVFAQVASFTASTDLRLAPFILGRAIHAFLALMISRVFLKLADFPAMNLTIPVEENRIWFSSLQLSTAFFTGSILLLLLTGILYALNFTKGSKS